MKMKSNPGQAGVEFALVFPLLLILLFGIIEFGVLLYDKAVITNASREGARFGIVARTPRYNASDITQVVNDYCANRLIRFRGTGLSIPPPIWDTQSFGGQLTVTVEYQYSFLVLPFLTGNTPINLRAVTVMKYE